MIITTERSELHLRKRIIALTAIISFGAFLAIVPEQIHNDSPKETIKQECTVVIPDTYKVSVEQNTEDIVGQSYDTETTEQEQPPEAIAEPAPQPRVIYYTEHDAIDIAKTLWRECGGVKSKTEQACVAWTIVNRADIYGCSISEVVRAKGQYAFKENTKVYDSMLELANDVLERWNLERNGQEEVGRVLPKEYVYFAGRNGHNYFRNKFSGDFTYWDYSLPSPYDN